MVWFWIIYSVGVIVAYYYHRWCLKTYLQGEDAWINVIFCGIFSPFSWGMVFIVTIVAIINGVFNIPGSKTKIPKWL